METKFLIIGMTGPLGSGCTEISKFICNELEQYKSDFINKHLRKIDTYIARYYRFLKDIDVAYMQKEKAINDINEKLFVDPEEYLKEFVIESYESNRHEDIAKKINRKLRQYLFIKKLMNYYCRTYWNKFTYISMSTVIVKIIIDHSIDNDDKQSRWLADYPLCQYK